MITVKVCDNQGRPYPNKEVTLSFSGMSRGQASGWTDSNGEVKIDRPDGDGKVYVSGNSSAVREGYLSGHITVSV